MERNVITLSDFEYKMDYKRKLRKEYEYDEDEIRTLVETHNAYRRNVTPTASDMNYVVSGCKRFELLLKHTMHV